MESDLKSGEAEAVILIKASPQVGQKHGETVCCAALDIYGRWLRLYPVSFRYLEDGKKVIAQVAGGEDAQAMAKVPSTKARMEFQADWPCKRAVPVTDR